MIPRVSCLCLTRWVLKNWFSNRACIKKLQKISLRLFLHWLLSWTCEIFSQSLNILVICSVLLTGYVSYVRPSGLNGLIVLLAELSFLLCFNPNWSSTKVSSLILIDLPNTILPNTRALLQIQIYHHGYKNFKQYTGWTGQVTQTVYLLSQSVVAANGQTSPLEQQQRWKRTSSWTSHRDFKAKCRVFISLLRIV